MGVRVYSCLLVEARSSTLSPCVGVLAVAVAPAQNGGHVGTART